MDPFAILFLVAIGVPVLIAALLPVYLLQVAGKFGWALFYVLALTALVAVDYFENWDGISYPFALAGIFVAMPWISFPILAATIAFAFFRLSSEPWRDK